METEKAEKKEKRNNYNIKAAGLTLLIVAFCIGIFLIANILTPFRGLEKRDELKGIMQSYFLITAMLSSIMLVISVYLVFTYLKDYLELRSSFTLGVLLAVVSFMLFAISANPLLHAILGISGKEGIFSVIPLVFATISLAMLAWVSSK